MINDYSERYFPAPAHRLPASRLLLQRKNSRQAASPWLLWRSVGLLLVVILAVGMGSSLWLGGMIRSTLDGIGRGQALHATLAEKNGRLLAQRDQLLSRERIEAAAAKLGLYPPTADQLRRLP